MKSGYVWCHCCGLLATATQEQREQLDADKETWCLACDAESIDSLLRHGDEMPMSIAPTYPMHQYKP